MCISMTCILRYVDVRYLRPKRMAFAEGLETGEIVIAGHTAAKTSIEGEVSDDGDVDKKTAEVTVKDATAKDFA